MSWEQLISMMVVNADNHAQFLTQPPQACPYGGFPLEQGSDGTLHCPEGDYFWPDDLTRTSS